MSFSQRLKKKIELDRLKKTVVSSLGLVSTEKKVDKPAMRELLKQAGWVQQKERDLELYIKEEADGAGNILVLDNELPVYSGVDANKVGIFKSPTWQEAVKHMIPIMYGQNKKILSRRKDTVENLYRELADGLDLTFNRADVKEIRLQAIGALDSGHGAGVEKGLALFAELLGWEFWQDFLKEPGLLAWGQEQRDPGKKRILGPVALLARGGENPAFMAGPIKLDKEEEKEKVRGAAIGSGQADARGGEVFRILEQLVGEKYSLNGDVRGRLEI